MDSQVALRFLAYERSKSRVYEVELREQERRSLVQMATLLRTVLLQQALLDGKTSQESQYKVSLKQDMSKIQHEKRLLENKVALLSSEVDTWKKKFANQNTLQKENMALKNQVTKLNSQVQEAKNETVKMTQRLVTQKAVLESKLENAKKNIKNLKEKPVSPTKPSLHQGKPLPPLETREPVPSTQGKPPLKRPEESNFSFSPFLSKRLSSPSKPATSVLSRQVDPQTTPTVAGKNVLAQSTPGANTLSPLKHVQSKLQRPSGLKNLLSPDKTDGQTELQQELPEKKQKKKSLFDDEDEDEDDFFGGRVKKPEPKKTPEESTEAGKSAQLKVNKKRKKRIGTKTIIEDDDLDDGKFSPLKRVKLMDTLGGVSPLKQRNRERSLFKI